VAWWLATAGLALAAGLAGAFWPRPSRTPPPPVRFLLESVPGLVSMQWPRLSPDGKVPPVHRHRLGLACCAATFRPADQLAAVPVAGTEGVGRAYWSPDGREVAFVSDQKIRRVALGGGAPVIVCSGVGCGSFVGFGRPDPDGRGRHRFAPGRSPPAAVS
jgi:hypothetical protein